ncbi:MBOAT family O-acyltransferase [Pseudoalteromonas sp. T1lg24]|uniref:MBOAT family O-acyltransferase n=1 Tax=Pseudoalteromonas sp. T1lg24 TaxID=2077099 RepID=UPI000CF66C43|nr:MBOAT family protein [Pseudoalteromonas sp. T1lg24]
MLFNSYEFILVFLPIVFLVYFFLNRYSRVSGKVLLVLSSLFFYGWWEAKYLLLILFSVAVNYLLGLKIFDCVNRGVSKNGKLLLVLGVLFNLSLLGYFKYTNFFLENLYLLLGVEFEKLSIILPLAISFFTFQQIAYLSDNYLGLTPRYKLLDYLLFVTFFPQLIAGPIVHHKEMMPQFVSNSSKYIKWNNVCLGLMIFCLGLFKKVVIADYFALTANQGFEVVSLNILEAWATSLSYTLQLYFDFSGYSDMAIGLALLFNIRLPMNFNSPYKAVSIQDFWRRWHITLSRFLRDYIYIPLGGNKVCEFKIYRNLCLVFLIGGIWHGAGWTFIVWGVLHGLATLVHKVWTKFNLNMPDWFAWVITFNFINITWVFFRAENINDAVKVLKGMFGFSGLSFNLNGFDGNFLLSKFDGMLQITPFLLLLILASILFCITTKNTMELMDDGDLLIKKPTFAILAGGALSVSLVMMVNVSDFLYFNF